jgi:hypothetical protein
VTSRAAKREQRRRQSERDRERQEEEARAQFWREQHAARTDLTDQWRLGEPTNIRNGMQAAIHLGPSTTFRLGVSRWWAVSGGGQEPLRVGLRPTPPDWDPQWNDARPTLVDTYWPRLATVQGLYAAVHLLADWLEFTGDRNQFPALLGLGGTPLVIAFIGGDS